MIIIIDRINDNDNSDNVEQSCKTSQNFFMTRGNDQLISIYLKLFFY